MDQVQKLIDDLVKDILASSSLPRETANPVTEGGPGSGRTPGSAQGNDKGREPETGGKVPFEVKNLKEIDFNALQHWKGSAGDIRYALRGAAHEGGVLSKVPGIDAHTIELAEAITGLVKNHIPTTSEFPLYRGLFNYEDALGELLAKVKEGDEIFVDDTICGWSLEKKQAEKFLSSSTTLPSVLFVLEGGRKKTSEFEIMQAYKDSPEIYNYTPHHDPYLLGEQEVLVDCTEQKFKVVKVETEGVLTIHLKELD
jgi:hypothetical protein